MIDSDSSVDKKPCSGLTSTNLGSMRKVVREVLSCVFCAVSNGILKGIVDINIIHPPLEAQALFFSNYVTVWDSVSGIIASDINPLAF